jgi:hypothetical protein
MAGPGPTLNWRSGLPLIGPRRGEVGSQAPLASNQAMAASGAGRDHDSRRRVIRVSWNRADIGSASIPRF